MRFQAVRGYKSPDWRQHLVYLIMGHLNYMPKEWMDEAYSLIGEIARNEVEGRALNKMLRKSVAPEAIHYEFGVTKERLYSMRKEFYDRFLSKTIRRN